MNQKPAISLGGVKSVLAGTLSLLAVTFGALPTSAFAQQQGYTSKYTNLRAGPSQDYPIVAAVPAGVALIVAGCLSGYRWCDVVVGPHRGWMYAGNIVYAYQGSQVPLLTYGSALGIGIIAFSVGSYWDDYYTAYPWYPQRQRWISRPQAYPSYGPDYGFVPDVGRRAPRAHVQAVPPQTQAPRVDPRDPQVQEPRGRQRAPQAHIRSVDPRQ